MCQKMFHKSSLTGSESTGYMKSRRRSSDLKKYKGVNKDSEWWKMWALRMAMPLLGVLVWVISSHAGTFTLASFIPHYFEGCFITTNQIDKIKCSQRKAIFSVTKIMDFHYFCMQTKDVLSYL
ncbi:uncharacterized protein LOC108734316 isoform X2 [Agrilus planipennis]|uniref:Uncharacterized protein LOC108734316 isoform X2 n=1 Tax=Agrilus planipennis TaxID=224129 RepID=A0A1W4WLI1_AGRPL|nr:uncharacterized protein LOC108734316 isoform X2 [Agrilus planipennis]